MRLAKTRRRDLHKLGVVKIIDRCGTGVPHGSTQTTHELVSNAINVSAERNTPLNTLRNQLFLTTDIRLEVAILRVRPLFTLQTAALHSPQ